MKFNTPADGHADFQIAPMLDIVFLLLVFFIATYAMAQMERELSITIPQVAKADDPVTRLNEIVINITASGNLIVNQQSVTLPELRTRLERLSAFGGLPGVIIRADADSATRHLAAVAGVCRDMDVPTIMLGTLSEPAPPALPAP